MKFLVTGGAGFIGSHIAEKLKDRGDVTIFDNMSVGKEENVPGECEIIKGDIRNGNDISRAMKGVDMVFHNAAFVSIRGSFKKIKDDIDTNCTGTLNVLNAAVQAGAKKVIFASSMAVYGEPENVKAKENDRAVPISPYGMSKLRGEMYCRLLKEEYGIEYSILRYFNTYGTKQTPSPYVGVMTTFINQAIEKKPLTVFGDGNQTRDFVWVEDVADANILTAFSKKTGTYNIGSGKEVSVNCIADKIIEVLGGGKIFNEKPRGEVERICADITNVKKDLNFEPKGDVLEKIPQIIDWWKSKK
ncbi:MAG: NAD-dependent epimerase/dehydratase family protein [Candidatus Aenigmarchaeota archaeon]